MTFNNTLDRELQPILVAIHQGHSRFREIQRSVNGITTKVFVRLPTQRMGFAGRLQIIKEIPSKDRLNVDLLIFLQSSKYICGTNAEYIQAIADLAKMYPTQLHKEKLRKEIFSVFQ